MVKLTVFEVLADKWWIAPLSLGAGLVATPIARWAAYHYKIVDRPDDLLKPHGRPVAYLGGLGMLVGLLAGIVAYLTIMPDLARHWRGIGQSLSGLQFQALLGNPLWKLMGIALAFIVITIVGLRDDICNLKPRQKVYGQILAAGILLLGGVADRMSMIFLNDLFVLAHAAPPYWLVLPVSTLLSVIIVVGACNATNLLDGLDGLCGGVTAIITLGFLALAVWLAMWENSWVEVAPRADNIKDIDAIRVVLCLAMFGAVLGFLPYNLPPASIFMGDAGSMLLGFFAATMMIMFCKAGTARWFIASCVVFSLPILDTGLAVIRRVLAHKSIFAGDRGHLYDQLVDRGMTVKQVVVLFYVLAAAGAAVGVFLSIWLRIREALPIYLVLLIVVVTVFYLLGMMTPPPKDSSKGQ